MLLSDFIFPDSSVSRSVNIERDTRTDSVIRNYKLTQKGLQIIDRLVSSLETDSQTSWSLTGPYGMGKSSFLSFLIALCGRHNDPKTVLARDRLHLKNQRILQRLLEQLNRYSAGKSGLFRIPIVASYQSVTASLAQGLLAALHNLVEIDGSDDFRINFEYGRLKDLVDRDRIEPQQIVKTLTNLKSLSNAPFLLAIDEFGKNLEFMAHNPDEGDIFVVQSLAETEGLHIFVSLHQAFGEYSASLNSKQLLEWSKIQGRFEDIPFVEPRNEMLQLIADTLQNRKLSSTMERLIGAWASDFDRRIKELKIDPMDSWDHKFIASFFPLHPVAALLIPEMCVKYAQNDRTLFAFLCSQEPDSLASFLRASHVDPELPSCGIYSLDRLYDYFISSAFTSMLNRPESQRLIEVNSIVNQCRNGSESSLALVKTIGLLNLVGSSVGLPASREVIQLCLHNPVVSPGTTNSEPGNSLSRLMESGKLIFRDYAHEYRLWEGSDFDVAEAVKKQKSLLVNESLTRILESVAPLSPMIASRHSYITGTLTRFSRRWTDLESLRDVNALHLDDEADGFLFYCFGDVLEPDSLPDRANDGRPIVVAYSSNIRRLFHMALEAKATSDLLIASNDLAKDGIARKEVRFRAQTAQKMLEERLEEIYSVNSSQTRWFAKGREFKPQSTRAISSILSDVCDHYYYKRPIIRNELVNRNKLTSAAARARRELLEAMTMAPTSQTFGLKGTGPEVAIYRTMILAENIHMSRDKISWTVEAPEPTSSLYHAWNEVRLTLEKNGDILTNLYDLFQILKKPPFGIKDGPIPIIVGLFLLVESAEVGLFHEGAYCPVIGPEEMELLSKRPAMFSIKLFKLTESKRLLLDIYRTVLGLKPDSGVGKFRNISLLSVVGPLVGFFNNLPEYVLQTKSMSANSQKLRQVILQGKEPADLVFRQIPEALGFPDVDQSQDEDQTKRFEQALRNAINETNQCFPTLLGRVISTYKHVFHHEGTVSSLRQNLVARFGLLEEQSSDGSIRPFLASIMNTAMDDNQWLIATATIASQRPLEAWRDSDFQPFQTKLARINMNLERLEALIAATGAMPSPKGSAHPRLISYTTSNGMTHNELVWLQKDSGKTLTDSLDKVISKHDTHELKALMALLGEHLFASETINGENHE